VYPPCDIDKVRERGETWPVDPEMREAFDRLGANMRGEIRTAVVEMRSYVDDRLQTTTADMRRHFEVVGESLRSDFRAVAGGVALLNQRMDRRDGEEAGRTDGIEGRVSRLEVRVTSLEDDRKPRQPRRRR
jgi:light-regulated signal transduction histidine kinase (bacteriophytochrome)